ARKFSYLYYKESAMKLASRMNRLGTETAFEVLARARALEAKGRDVVHLEIGEPDFDTPAHIVAAGVAALHAGYTHYGPSPGIPELRDSIARNAGAKRGLTFGAEQVVVTPGGKPIMFYVLLALAEEGDEVIYPNPGFPIYESMIDFVGARAVPMPLREENQFRLDLAELESLITGRTRLIIINSPANPTGGVLERSDVQRIAELAVEHDLVVLSDEIYCDILYEGTHVSIAEFSGMADRTIILDGFSKAYAMTGWRMGYGIMPVALVPSISRLVTNSVSCTATFIQRAGIVALDGPQNAVRTMVEEFRRRRQVIVDGLNAIPRIRCARPSGAFYVFPYVGDVGMDCRAFADYLLNEAGVATLAGTSFGKFGDGYLRLSYANSVENLRKALERIDGAVRHLT
ncbi:MAG TPA: pyridoxal phosphate-dependent aminotransferase, partial [Chloroflexota bacterium]|nr:pyridoxal phosphate-dependent aminotransferase [Chloroflexota bacterium]